MKQPTVRPAFVSLTLLLACSASAHGLDTSIAEKGIVYYINLRVDNWHYERASELVARHFRVVNRGDGNGWIPNRCRGEWRVLPRPEKCEGKDNGPENDEWRVPTEMHVPVLDHMVRQFQTRGDYGQGERTGDGDLDGTFLHAGLPGILADAAL